ncbi:phosphoribosyltransferase [Terrimonas sp.]|uniref:phosphoribosyltransferase family protein n=1 Tax=Terrimonas sp. TaxID=1914338 RepID=UPI000D522B60|nr:phosphoribosyltransferase family protein [Terrimonas sp.]PVD51733.1 phosphoribosyltransferase [Terrimonas sp.]
MKNYILTEAQVAKKLQRMAYEIAERNVGEEKLLFAGIKDNGVVIAKRLKTLLSTIFKGEIDIIEMEIDDKRFPRKITLSKTPNFDNAVVIVIDDVANSGKTMLYALQPFSKDQPKKIQTLALVDRTHKTFPVHTDYIGFAVATTLQEHIFVEVDNNEKITGAWLE